MKIITIRGAKNSGKTTILRNLLQKICIMRDTTLVEYIPEGKDKCDFKAAISVNGKIVVINSCGDAIEFIRDGLKFAESKSADIFITAWNTDLEKKYEIKIELRDAEIIDNPVQIFESLKTQWMDFANMIVQKF